MARSNAERQQTYRQRRPKAGDNGERRLNTWITTGAALALQRLARHYAVTKREMLERIILEADDTILKTLPADSPELNAYLGVTQ